MFALHHRFALIAVAAFASLASVACTQSTDDGTPSPSSSSTQETQETQPTDSTKTEPSKTITLGKRKTTPESKTQCPEIDIPACASTDELVTGNDENGCSYAYCKPAAEPAN